MKATRRRALTWAGAGIAAALARPSLPLAEADTSTDALDSALAASLTLEQSTVEAYDYFIGAGIATGEVRDAFNANRRHDRGHAHRLRVILVERAVVPPQAPDPSQIVSLSATTTLPAALQLVTSLEEQTIGSYFALVRMVAHRQLARTIAGAINSNAQQLVVLRTLAGQPPVPSAFESGSTPQ